jgi:hypothetical protein
MILIIFITMVAVLVSDPFIPWRMPAGDLVLGARDLKGHTLAELGRCERLIYGSAVLLEIGKGTA